MAFCALNEAKGMGIKMERRNKGKNATIIAALIGVIGTIIAAVIGVIPIRRSGRQRRSKTISGDCKKRKNCYSKERSNLKHISGAVCL